MLVMQNCMFIIKDFMVLLKASVTRPVAMQFEFIKFSNCIQPT
jgi:hypothetical protein